MSASSSESELPPRIVHLPSGLRAVDDRSDKVTVQIASDLPVASLPTPEYPQLYRVLASRGLSPIGVEFINVGSYTGVSPPDWQFFSMTAGFALMVERNEWSYIRHAAHDDREPAVADIASRCKTYLDLLSIRLLQLSQAYNQTFREWKSNSGVIGDLFSNMFVPYIDAAVHAFVSDCASFRDLIAEIVWRLILRESASVTTFSSFLKRAKDVHHPLVVEIVAAGRPQEWIKEFTDLRNDIVHVAPMGRAQVFHSCQIREYDVGSSINVPKLHYPLLAADGSICRKDAGDIDFHDEETVKAALREVVLEIWTGG